MGSGVFIHLHWRATVLMIPGPLLALSLRSQRAEGMIHISWNAEIREEKKLAPEWLGYT